MAWDDQSPNTGETMKADNPDGQRKLWEKGVEVSEQSENFFGPMEGKNPTSLIQTKTDTAKGQGQSITFTNKSGYYGRGKKGEQLFSAKEDFEKDRTGSYKLMVDYLRNAHRHTERAEELMGLRGEIMSGVPQELGKWLGREKTHRMFMLFRDKLTKENVIYANRKTEATLTSADTLSWNTVVSMGTILKPLGGLPAHVGTDSGKKPIHKNCVVASTTTLFSLDMDDDYRQLVRDAGTRGKTNSIFSGGFEDVKGHVIKEYTAIDHDGVGPVGSPMNPKASLGVAITADATGLIVKGGGNAADSAEDVDFFRDFPNFAYEFNFEDTLAVDATERYFLIVNPPNAETDPGKIGMYAYVGGNIGTQITVTKALGSGTARVGTVGGVTLNGGVWAGMHTEVHPEGSTIIPCNRLGVPIGWSHMLGQRAAYRGYGKHQNQRSEQKHEGGFIKDIFITSVFGQSLRENRQGRHTGAITLCHAVQYPELNLPIVA